MKANTVTLRVAQSFNEFFRNSFQFLVKHKELTLILFMGFIIRYFLLDWNSYWLDELFSVYEWGIRFESSYELLIHFRDLAYPVPLYELILFNWMRLFGHSEVATRILSTIFVTLATLFLYLLTLRVFSRRIAVATILFFTLSYMAVFYSLETRYYGLILFLSILSSYLMILYLERLGSNYSWRRVYCNRYFVLLTFTNAALILTHTHTLLFIVSQSVFFLLYSTYMNRIEKLLPVIAKVIIIYITQGILVFALWGFVIIEFVRQVVNNTFEGLPGVGLFLNQPHLIFFKNVVEPNLSLPVITYDRLAYLSLILQKLDILIFIAMILFFVVIAIKYNWPMRLNKPGSILFKHKVFIYYIILWLFMPTALLCLIYSFGYFDRFFGRYIIFCIPPLMILTVITLERGLSLLDYLCRRLLRITFIRHYLRYAIIYAIIAAVLLIVPGGFLGATERKADWRGITNNIVEHIHNDPDHSYIILETTHSPYYTLLDYYFEQYSDHVRVYDTIRRTVETGLLMDVNYTPWFAEPESEGVFSRYDFLIVSFHDLSVSHFPLTIKTLSEQYELTGQYLDEQGRGYMIFKVNIH